MMTSVRRQSQYNVKFWIINTFLSPQFKATLPIMSKMYNFSYQLVTYRWPSWLRPQFEKQRIIWGNKILFLDVLFPLELDRVIYIDADQVVRTDLIELMRMDFNNAPYEFRPFCEELFHSAVGMHPLKGRYLDGLQIEVEKIICFILFFQFFFLCSWNFASFDSRVGVLCEEAADSLKFALNVFRSFKPIFVWFSPCIGSPFKS
jgi:hypothetical protein